MAKEAAGKEWFKRCSKRPSDQLLYQRKGTEAVRATGFSKEQVEICFDLYGNELDACGYPHSLISYVDETGLAGFREIEQKILTPKGKRQIGAERAS